VYGHGGCFAPESKVYICGEKKLAHTLPTPAVFNLQEDSAGVAASSEDAAVDSAAPRENDKLG